MKEKKKSIALDIGGTRIKIAVVTDGTVEDFTVLPSLSHLPLKDRLCDIENAVKKLVGKNTDGFFGMGIAMPCLVNPEKKRATEIYAKFTDAPELDLAAWSKEKFGLPIVMEQDSKAALLGEANFGAAKGYKDIVMVILGTGVGTAVMLDGRLLNGKHFSAGSLGSHIVIEMKNGRKCTCRGRGCLEAYTSGWALPSLIKDHPDYGKSLFSKEKTLDFRALEKLVGKGDRVAEDRLDTVVTALRAGLISFIHAYDPEVVVLSGGPLKMGDLFVKPLLDGINDFIWGNGRKVDFVTAENPDVSVLLGLHYLAEKEYGDEKQ